MDLAPGTKVRVAHKRGLHVLVAAIPGGWRVLGPDHAIHAYRHDRIKATR